MADPKTVTLPVRADTWAMIERLRVVLETKLGRETTAEECAALLLEMGLRAIAEDLRNSCDPGTMEVARALMGI